MQNTNQKLSFRYEYTTTCLEAIKSSFEYLTVVENYLDTQKTIIETSLPSFVSKTNYIAIIVLGKLGMIDPTQEKIDMIELLILLIWSKKLTPENFKLCTDVDIDKLKSLLQDIDNIVKL